VPEEKKPRGMKKTDEWLQGLDKKTLEDEKERERVAARKRTTERYNALMKERYPGALVRETKALRDEGLPTGTGTRSSMQSLGEASASVGEGLSDIGDLKVAVGNAEDELLTLQDRTVELADFLTDSTAAAAARQLVSEATGKIEEVKNLLAAIETEYTNIQDYLGNPA
jgi:hypothetical protein